jgi:hypothetical protein
LVTRENWGNAGRLIKILEEAGQVFTVIEINELSKFVLTFRMCLVNYEKWPNVFEQCKIENVNLEAVIIGTVIVIMMVAADFLVLALLIIHEVATVDVIVKNHR